MRSKRNLSAFISNILTGYHRSVVHPSFIILVVILSIFLSEMLVMLMLKHFPPMTVTTQALVDAFLLVVLIFPSLYIFAFRPLIHMIVQAGLTEERLKHYAAEVEETNNEIRSFAYIVSHDLRAPLVSINGFSKEIVASCEEIREILEDYDNCEISGGVDYRKKLSEKMRDIDEDVAFVASSVTRMSGQIDALLKLSREGLRTFTAEEVDVSALVAGILKSMAHQIERGGVHVDVAPLPVISGDRMALEQIFGNLIDNAFKYLEPARVGKISISSSSEGAGTRFSIRDNGRGIEEKDMEKIFSIFRRGTNHDILGEGLGLSYVKTLVRRHGGRIWFESVLGEGTVFHVSLPLVVNYGIEH